MQNVLEIFNWYKKNLRDLPWRSTKDPYKIWLSEVILQQTQVVQGLKYYYKFISEYPDIVSLAQADEQEVLKHWQGLGYYSRARNLLATAKIITEQYHGKFPNEYAQLLKLPGIGEYTASAIMSFAYNKPYPALDSNVYRVVARLFNINLPVNHPSSKKVFMEILNEMIHNVDPSQFNNAMMEFGAMLCKPEQPACNECPVSYSCEALKNKNVHLLPVKLPKQKRKIRYFNYYYIQFKDSTYFQKRAEGDIWQNLYQIPMIETNNEVQESELLPLFESNLVKTPKYEVHKIQTKKHILTHQEIRANFIEIKLQTKPEFLVNDLIQLKILEQLNYPVPVLIENFLLSL